MTMNSGDDVHNLFAEDPKRSVLHSTALPKGRKFDGDKERWDLLPWKQVGDVVRVLTRGALKYTLFGKCDCGDLRPSEHTDDCASRTVLSKGEWNWKYVSEPKARYFAALQRHLHKRFILGEKLDPEWGLPHLAHAGCCLLFLAYLDDNPPEGWEQDMPV